MENSCWDFVPAAFRGSRSSLKLSTAVIAVALSQGVAADPVNWTLDDVTFQNGGVLTGSFTFDADTGVVSNVSASLNPGFGYFYPDQVPGGPITYYVKGVSQGPLDLELEDQPPDLPSFASVNFVALIPQRALTDLGGVIGLTPDTQAFDPYPTLSPYGEAQTFLLSGSIDGTPVPVPEPGAFVTMASGLALLGAIWRRRIRPFAEPVNRCG